VRHLKFHKELCSFSQFTTTEREREISLGERERERERERDQPWRISVMIRTMSLSC